MRSGCVRQPCNFWTNFHRGRWACDRREAPRPAQRHLAGWSSPRMTEGRPGFASDFVVLLSPAMKFGVRLLLLVALLLPFRGALAVGGLLCHGSANHHSVAAAVQATPAMHLHQSHTVPAGHHHDQSAVQLVVADSHSGDDSAACNLCSAVCSAPPLPSPGLAVHALLPIGAERFPATAPSHSSVSLDGLERPPRAV
jgi:hypothetical protein